MLPVYRVATQRPGIVVLQASPETWQTLIDELQRLKTSESLAAAAAISVARSRLAKPGRTLRLQLPVSTQTAIFDVVDLY